MKGGSLLDGASFHNTGGLSLQDDDLSSNLLFMQIGP